MGLPNNSRRVECIYCGHAQAIRVRAGKHWTCKKCGEPNPGPRMLAALYRKAAAAGETGASKTAAGRRSPGRPASSASNGSSRAAAVKTQRAAPASPARRKAQVGGTTSRTPATTKAQPRARNVTRARNDATTQRGTTSSPPNNGQKPAAGAAGFLRKLAYG